MALSIAALVAAGLMMNPAGADKPEYSGSYSAQNGSGPKTSAEVTIDQERDGEWTIRLVGQRLPDSIESFNVQTVNDGGSPTLHVVCELEPALLQESCTVRDVDLEDGRAGAAPSWAALMAFDAAAGSYAPVISFPLEQP